MLLFKIELTQQITQKHSLTSTTCALDNVMTRLRKLRLQQILIYTSYEKLQPPVK